MTRTWSELDTDLLTANIDVSTFTSVSVENDTIHRFMVDTSPTESEISLRNELIRVSAQIQMEEFPQFKEVFERVNKELEEFGMLTTETRHCLVEKVTSWNPLELFETTVSILDEMISWNEQRSFDAIVCSSFLAPHSLSLAGNGKVSLLVCHSLEESHLAAWSLKCFDVSVAMILNWTRKRPTDSFDFWKCLGDEVKQQESIFPSLLQARLGKGLVVILLEQLLSNYFVKKLDTHSELEKNEEVKSLQNTFHSNQRIQISSLFCLPGFSSQLCDNLLDSLRNHQQISCMTAVLFAQKWNCDGVVSIGKLVSQKWSLTMPSLPVFVRISHNLMSTVLYVQQPRNTTQQSDTIGTFAQTVFYCWYQAVMEKSQKGSSASMDSLASEPDSSSHAIFVSSFHVALNFLLALPSSSNSLDIHHYQTAILLVHFASLLEKPTPGITATARPEHVLRLQDSLPSTCQKTHPFLQTIASVVVRVLKSLPAIPEPFAESPPHVSDAVLTHPLLQATLAFLYDRLSPKLIDEFAMMWGLNSVGIVPGREGTKTVQRNKYSHAIWRAACGRHGRAGIATWLDTLHFVLLETTRHSQRSMSVAAMEKLLRWNAVALPSLGPIGVFLRQAGLLYSPEERVSEGKRRRRGMGVSAESRSRSPTLNLNRDTIVGEHQRNRQDNLSSWLWRDAVDRISPRLMPRLELPLQCEHARKLLKHTRAALEEILSVMPSSIQVVMYVGNVGERLGKWSLFKARHGGDLDAFSLQEFLMQHPEHFRLVGNIVRRVTPGEQNTQLQRLTYNSPGDRLVARDEAWKATSGLATQRRRARRKSAGTFKRKVLERAEDAVHRSTRLTTRGKKRKISSLRNKARFDRNRKAAPAKVTGYVRPTSRLLKGRGNKKNARTTKR